MTEEQIVLCKILKSFIREEKLEELDGDCDWASVKQSADLNSVTGIMSYVLMLNPLEQVKSILPMLRKECMQTIAIYTQKAAAMDELCIQLNGKHIPHLLMKGYVVKDYYPVPELRTFGDIDFVIHPEDREKCHQLMMELGFQIDHDWEPVMSYYRNLEYYEIHTNIMEVDVSDKADYKNYFKQMWNHVTPRNDYTFEMTPEFHLLYMLTHIAKHINGSGAGIRMYLDIAVFIEHYRDSINWDYFMEQIKILRFDSFINTVFSMLNKIFDVNIPIPYKTVDEDILDDFLVFTLEGGTFGHVYKNEALNLLKQENRDDDKTVNRLATFTKKLFPSAERLQNRYTYLKGKHWLLPIAWLHRLVKTRSDFDFHMNQAKGIMNADKEEVLRLKRIYKEIGL